MQDLKTNAEFKMWNPFQIIQEPDKYPYAVVLLNQPVGDNFVEIFLKLWERSVLRVAVDGGAAFLHGLQSSSRSFSKPDLVTGDFDSVPAEVLQYYQNEGSSIIHTPDQDDTDFTKALRLTNETLLSEKIKADAVLVICRNGGRLDHIMGNLNTLFYVAQEALLPTYLLSSESITWLLEKGRHKVPVNQDVMGTCCGLIPLGAPCTSVTTTGLKWNLKNGFLQFGQLVSTSNTYSGSDFVTVETDNHLLWTMETRW